MLNTIWDGAAVANPPEAVRFETFAWQQLKGTHLRNVLWEVAMQMGMCCQGPM